MRVKELLKEKGMTAKELAVKLGMTETGLGIALSEKGNPPLKRLQDIAAALNVPISDLFTQPKDNTVNCPYCGNRIKLIQDVGNISEDSTTTK